MRLTRIINEKTRLDRVKNVDIRDSLHRESLKEKVENDISDGMDIRNEWKKENFSRK